MTLRDAFPLLFAAWGVSELFLNSLKRARVGGAVTDAASGARPGAQTVRDRGSHGIVIGSVVAAIALALVAQRVQAAAMPGPLDLLVVLGTLALLGGVALRWCAILTLGRYFTVNVAVQHGHRVVQSGPYRFVRHPSYTGVLLALLGVGLAMHNWLSLAALLVPVTLSLAYRIRVEEAVLAEALGDDYRAYARRTKRLVPGVY